MSQERFDVVLKALNGPLAAMGEQKLQGPLVRIGANPGPGGLALTGYRGVDARQAVITAYGEGEATIGPVGTNQVRMAPHPNVNWKEIDPLTVPEYLNEGCAIHLGPVGRGCTLQFVRVEKLGVWTAGRVGSATENVSAVEVSAPVAAARRAAPKRSVARIAAATLPIWLVGCSGLAVASIAAVALILVYVRPPEIERLGPVIEGEEYYQRVDIEEYKVDEKTLEGLREPFKQFVALPSAERARQAGRDDVDMVTDPDNWDEKFFEYTSASLKQYIAAKSFFRRMDDVHKVYAQVLTQLREAGLPEAIAAMPYTESRYKSEMQSWACAKGFWQFMPEVAYRLERKNGLDFRVRDCELRKPDGSTFSWSPDSYAPPAGISKNGAIYLDPSVPKGEKGFPPEKCLIPVNGGCRVDDRVDSQRSTAAAIASLREAWDDDELAKSGAAVAMTILSHNGGYDDSRYGLKKSINVLPAYRAWVKKSNVPVEERHKFYGENIKCVDKHATGFCGSKLAQETQHYGYTIVSQHMLAVCYFGKNYADKIEAFRNWDKMVNGYCAQFNIPTAQMVQSWR